MAYIPPFSITNEIISSIANIAQKIGKVEAYERLSRAPQLRKENRIRTIHSSLAIEQNTLTLEQVTALVEGKRVLAPPKDLLEVQNAIKVYEELDSFDPLSINDLLTAHGMLMGGLTEDAGRFRSGNVGVFDGDQLIHAGTPAAYVPEVMADLFDWLRSGSAHPLVASCVFHYEFEFIHPFSDGNGRMGRLWQTLILSQWNSLFAWLPVESLVKEKQADYYAVLGRSDAKADCTEFVVFMLGMIDATLDEIIQAQEEVDSNVVDVVDADVNGVVNDAEKEALEDGILRLMKETPSASAASMAEKLGISARQVQRYIKQLRETGRIERVGGTRGYWKVND